MNTLLFTTAAKHISDGAATLQYYLGLETISQYDPATGKGAILVSEPLVDLSGRYKTRECDGPVKRNSIYWIGSFEKVAIILRGFGFDVTHKSFEGWIKIVNIDLNPD